MPASRSRSTGLPMADASPTSILPEELQTRRVSENVWLLSIDSGQRQRFRNTPAESLDPQFSPDGRYIA